MHVWRPVRSYYQEGVPVVSGADFVERDQSHAEVLEVAVAIQAPAWVIDRTLWGKQSKGFDVSSSAL